MKPRKIPEPKEIAVLMEAEFTVPWYQKQRAPAPQRRESDIAGKEADLTKRNKAFAPDIEKLKKTIGPLIGKRFKVIRPRNPANPYAKFGKTGIVMKMSMPRNWDATTNVYTLNFDNDVTIGGKPSKRPFTNIDAFLKFLKIVDDTHPLDLTPTPKRRREMEQARKKKARTAKAKAKENAAYAALGHKYTKKPGDKWHNADPYRRKQMEEPEEREGY